MPVTTVDTTSMVKYHSLQPSPLSRYVSETKKSGDLRFCKWCSKFKPDRAHHCRVLGKCVLKMDHHCPWIYNTVGFKNHKLFFLILIYGVLVLCIFVTSLWTDVKAWSTASLVASGVDGYSPAGYNALTTPGVPRSPAFGALFMLLNGFSVGCLLLMGVSFFLMFHLHLVCCNATTIEFCEKGAGEVNLPLWETLKELCWGPQKPQESGTEAEASRNKKSKKQFDAEDYYLPKPDVANLFSSRTYFTKQHIQQ